MSDTTSCPAAETIKAASTWLIMLQADHVSTADKAAFVDWLLQSTAHMREYLWCDQLWSWLQEIDWDHVAVANEMCVREPSAALSRTYPH